LFKSSGLSIPKSSKLMMIRQQKPSFISRVVLVIIYRQSWKKEKRLPHHHLLVMHRLPTMKAVLNGLWLGLSMKTRFSILIVILSPPRWAAPMNWACAVR